MNAELHRLAENQSVEAPWYRWGPYLSDRQWGTVREDYSKEGSAWEYFPHDHARSRAYRWGEDGLGGFCDRAGELCFALALWNGHDPILKERLFGLTNRQGNHGEDVKEYHFYLDNTPTHSYMRWLYKYPQLAFPYEQLVEENARRSKLQPEYELLDTGIFDNDRYFDVVAEYAKADLDDICIRIQVTNRSSETANIDVLPTLWFRNTWAWNGSQPLSSLKLANGAIQAHTEKQETFWLFCDASPQFLYTDSFMSTPSSKPLESNASDNLSPPTVDYWHVWTDPDGISHQSRCQIQNFTLKSISPPASPQWLDQMQQTDATVVFTVQPVGWVGSWHENPKPQWIIPLSGCWFVETMDGQRVEMGVGEISFGEDQNTKADAQGHQGHLSGTVGDIPAVLMIMQLQETPTIGQACRFR